MNTITKQVVDFIAKFEGYSAVPYKDSVGIPTIGYGTITYPNGKRVTMQDKSITVDTAKEFLMYHITNMMLSWINSNLPDLTPNQFTAVVSLIYNIGLGAFKDSTVFKRIKAKSSCVLIQEAFNMWNKASGKVLKGLVGRRAEEGKLFCKN